MAAGERAKKRAEREAAAAAAEAVRRAEAERRARRTAVVARWTRWVPRGGTSHGRGATLAAKKRQQTVALIGLVVAVNTLVFLGTTSWAARAMALLLSLLLAPIAATLANRK